MEAGRKGKRRTGGSGFLKTLSVPDAVVRSRYDGVSTDNGPSVPQRLPKTPCLADLEDASVCVSPLLWRQCNEGTSKPNMYYSE